MILGLGVVMVNPLFRVPVRPSGFVTTTFQTPAGTLVIGMMQVILDGGVTTTFVDGMAG